MDNPPKTFPRRGAVVTPEIVRIIRRDWPRIPAHEFSKAYGISGEQVRRIGRREAWAWVPEEGEAPEVGSTMPSTITDEQAREAEQRALQQLAELDKTK